MKYNIEQLSQLKYSSGRIIDLLRAISRAEKEISDNQEKEMYVVMRKNAISDWQKEIDAEELLIQSLVINS